MSDLESDILSRGNTLYLSTLTYTISDHVRQSGGTSSERPIGLSNNQSIHRCSKFQIHVVTKELASLNQR
jgi:hypothetical protein